MKHFVTIIVLIALFIGCQNSSNNEKSSLDPSDKVTVEMFVSGMTCAGCENAIVQRVSELDGSIEAIASFQEGTVTIVFDKNKLLPEDIAAAIDKKGYTVESFVINDVLSSSTEIITE